MVEVSRGQVKCHELLQEVYLSQEKHLNPRTLESLNPFLVIPGEA